MFAGGGFGGDAGAQFAGGGFMPSQANDAGFGGGGSGGGKGGRAAQTLRTLTIRQLAKELAHQDDENYSVDGAEVANLTVLGKITAVQDRNVSLAITLDDGTGELELHTWLTDDNEAANQAKRAELRPGVYIKAHGHLKQNTDKSKGAVMSAFAVRPITNFNELTYHYLRAIFEHLHLTRGGAAAPGGQQGAGGMGAPAGGYGAPQAGGWQQQQPAHGATAFAGAGGVDPCQGAVLSIIQASHTEQGVNQTEVYNKLAGTHARGAIDAALQALMAEAHIYNTIDDNHWKAA